MDILYSQQNQAGLPANLAVAVTLAASMLSPLSAEEQEGTSFTEAIPAYRDCITASCAAPTPEGKIEATTQSQPAATPAAGRPDDSIVSGNKDRRPVNTQIIGEQTPGGCVTASCRAPTPQGEAASSTDASGSHVYEDADRRCEGVQACASRREPVLTPEEIEQALQSCTLSACQEAKALLARLTDEAAAAEYKTVANELGPVIDEMRQGDMARDPLIAVHALCNQMRARTENRIRLAEAETEEDEAALETLYRSQVWDDLSFSLAAFPYWRAWIDLEIARLNPDRQELTRDLLPARKGFRAASMQLFRPGLVFGGWLGLGYVEMQQGRQQVALAIFENLDQALAQEPDHPVRKAVQLELRLLEAHEGKVKTMRKGRMVDDTEAVLLKVEAFALLQGHRKTGGRPMDAAERLRAVIESGRIDNQMLSDMMHFRQELSSVDVGAYTDLAGAEFAMEYEHWYQAMQKYEAFFNYVIAPPGLDLTNYRYRWALAAYRAEIYGPAVDILEKLVRQKDLVPELDKASSKLLYAVYASREKAGGSKKNRKLLRTAAQRFIRKNPDDPSADSARLMMAQTAANASTALKTLNQVKAPRELKGDVERTAFFIIAREFTRKIRRRQDSAAAGIAKQGIAAWKTLPKPDKKDQRNLAVLIEMRALVDEEPEKVLESLNKIEQKATEEETKLSLNVRRALVWSRLKLFDRLGDAELALSYVRQLAATGIPSWQLEYLYPWISERENVSERYTLLRMVRPAVKDQPEMDRRFRAMMVETLLAQDEVARAYDEALEFAKLYPTSGDAWKMLATASEASEQPFEADRAWGVITDKAVPTMPIWWEGMLSRVRIRNDSTRPEAACSLLVELASHNQYLPSNFKDELTAVQNGARCGG